MKTRQRGLWAGWAGMTLALAMTAQAGSPGTVTCKIELDRGVLPAGQPQKAVLKVSLEGLMPAARRDRPPVNLAVILDKSGSMSGEKIANAREAALEAVRRLDASDLFSLVVYDTGVETVVPARLVGDADDIERQIRRIQAGGNTALFGGVSQGAAELRKNLEPRYVHRAILLSDGLANVGPSTPEDLGRLGAALIKEGISVTTVGVGTDYNEDLMARLAQLSDGNTYFVRESSDLARIFREELGDVLTVVARKVRILIECPAGVRPLAVLGREGRIAGRTVDVQLSQLYGGQEKFALVEVEITAADAGGTRDVAVARVSYEDALTGRAGVASATAAARFSASDREVTASANAHVQKAYELNRNATAQDEAIALADQGKNKEAAKRLTTAAGYLKVAGTQLGDKELEAKAEELSRQADELERGVLSSGSRKAMRADSWQTVNQQRAR